MKISNGKGIHVLGCAHRAGSTPANRMVCSKVVAVSRAGLFRSSGQAVKHNRHRCDCLAVVHRHTYPITQKVDLHHPNRRGTDARLVGGVYPATELPTTTQPTCSTCTPEIDELSWQLDTLIGTRGDPQTQPHCGGGTAHAVRSVGKVPHLPDTSAAVVVQPVSGRGTHSAGTGLPTCEKPPRWQWLGYVTAIFKSPIYRFDYQHRKPIHLITHSLKLPALLTGIITTHH